MHRIAFPLKLKTFKCEIFSSIFLIDFGQIDSTGGIFGFFERALEPPQRQTLDLSVNIIEERTISPRE